MKYFFEGFKNDGFSYTKKSKKGMIAYPCMIVIHPFSYVASAWVGINNPGRVTSEVSPLTADFVETNLKWMDGTGITFYDGLTISGLRRNIK